MANDLKPMLAKVISSGGDKKFFFAYGIGKRKDKKGDGELAVGGKKPKKPDIEGALDGCKEVMEGFCWVGKGSEDNKTIYFQCKGKKLSQMIVAKMALTAKLTTGHQHDFQLPSPEEEARADKFKEGEGDESSSEETDGDDPAAQFKAKLAAWTPAIKEAMAAKGPHAAEIAKLLAQATALSKPGADMPQALSKLSACYVLATKQTPGTKDAPGTNDKAPDVATALAGWQAARETALGQLRALAKAIATDSDDDRKDQAIILVNAIIKNLTPKPENLQSVIELERYIATDDVITDAEIPNDWDITVELKEPLGAAVATMKKAFGG